MIQAQVNQECGPNVSSKAENFFQSDRDLILKKQKDSKRMKYGSNGNPITVSAKILYFNIIRDTAYLGLSSHEALKLDLDTKKPMICFKGHKGPITCLVIYTDGARHFLITASWDKTIKQWCAETGDLINTFSAHDDFVKSVKVFGSKLYSSSTDKSIIEWDIKTGKIVRSFKGHRRSVEDIAISSDGMFLYSASSDNSILKWDLATGLTVQNFSGHLTSIRKLLLLDEDETLWSVSADKTACKWDLEVYLF